MKRYGAIVLLFIAIILFTVMDNHRLLVRSITLESNLLLESANPIKIVHLSDLHLHQGSRVSRSLISTIANLQPDIIAITGDMLDMKSTSTIELAELLLGLRSIAPVYCVPGNHDYWSNLDGELQTVLEGKNINFLRNAQRNLLIHGTPVSIIGLDDPAGGRFTEGLVYLKSNLPDGVFHILLSHRPEYFADYCLPNLSLVLAGHAHGGQFRLPGIGPVIAPDQGFLPKYTQGPYTDGQTTMLVSRGLGNSIIPFRINNPFEIVYITITPKQ